MAEGGRRSGCGEIIVLVLFMVVVILGAALYAWIFGDPHDWFE